MSRLTGTERAVACEMARVDLYTFSRFMFLERRGYKWMRGPHHKIICDALMRVFNGECKRLIINVPPRYSKTELAVVNFMAWALGQVPDAEFIHTSYSGTLAANNAWQTRELVQHETYREIFPGTVLRSDSTAKSEWRTTAGGIVYATGSGGTITGYGAGKHRPGFGGAIIIDDPHKADEATSDVIRQNVIDWFQNTLESRKNDPKNTPMILIMQRLHVKDLAGWLLEGGNGEQWEHICIPAISDAGEALWPEKHSIEQLRTMQAANKYVFAGQYMQRPTILGGDIIKGEWFRRYTVAPNIKYRKIFADTAQKAKEHNDYSVFLCVGMGDDGKLYLLDMIRGKWEAPELKRRAVAFWEKHKPTETFRMGALRALVVEDKASGTGLIQEIRASGSIPIKPIEPQKDKLTRVMDVVSYIEAGMVCLPESAAWVSDFLGECEAFTANDAHAHDDQVDTLCYAISDMLAKGKSIYDAL